MTDDRKLSAYVDPHLTDAETAQQWQAIDDRLGHEGSARATRPVWFRGPMAFALGAAAVALVAAAGAVFRSSHQASPASAWDGAVLDSGGDRMSVSLGDGSRIELERASRVLVHEGTARSVRLEMPKGGAHFDVPHVEGRSFEVLAEGVRVQVVGTRFSVMTTDVTGGHLVTVSVERGAVVAGPESGGEPVRIREGETWSTVRPTAPAAHAENPALATPAPSTHEGPEPRPAAAMPPAPEPASGQGPSRAAAAESEPLVTGHGAPSAATEATARVATGAVAESTAQELFEKANAARQGGDARGAAAAYDSLLRHYPSDARAGLAAFELGRLKMDQLGDLPGAVAALGRAVTLAPGPGFREDALARLVRAYGTLGNSKGCEAARKQYLGSYPNGVHAAAVRKACGGAP